MNSHRATYWAVTILGVVLVTLGGVGCSGPSGNGTGSGGGGPRVGKLSGDMTDWIGTACSGGSATQEANLSPLGDGICHQDYSKPETVSNLKAVLYARFDSEQSMLRMMSIVKPAYYAAGRSDGVYTVFYVMSDQYVDELLEPLGKFGFVVNTGPQYAAADAAGPTQSQRPSTPVDAPVVAPVPAPTTRVATVTPDSELQWRFQSRTGNIACDLNGSSRPPEATCEVRQHTYQPKVKSSCDPGWANRFTLRQGQTVEVNCYPGTDFREALPVQNYGAPLTVGSLTCVLDEDAGVTCKDSTTGHYFQAARQEYEWR